MTTLAAGIADALGSPLSIAAIYDRDYHSKEQIDEVVETLSKNLALAHVHTRKEIENYLLIPNALRRAIDRIQSNRSTHQDTHMPNVDIESLLYSIIDPMRDEVMSQIVAKRLEKLKPKGRDQADIMKESVAEFNLKWKFLEDRLTIAPGKEVLRAVRTHLQEQLGVSLTDTRIIEAMRKDDIPEDLRNLLHEIDKFRTSTQDMS